ncbi:MAG TPA: ATP-binding protein [Pirellulales bacterium]|nr:ATP-binding protein [Pirellulales bacterium]
MSATSPPLLLRSNLKQLRLPAMSAEFEKLAREAAAADESHEQYLLRLTELEVAARAGNALQARIKQAGFPLHKDFDTFDFTATPWLNKPKLLELGRGQWIDECSNVCLLGSVGTGKPQPA